ncbi:MAG: hypothetical protein OQK75_03945 [Gammaproteobacteria bacterium]|nr:hypothetical protein [Gammaproteobacteria bacterium]MCW8986801.1 hypothetical protein [Gammaproteobacteria bacterium]MCW9030229.1 hypothetical protein [Gammaproteobacteria bacterium]
MLKKLWLKLILTISAFIFINSAFANNVEIIKVVLTKQAGTWRADVTLKHADTGWEHYADSWRLVDSNGNEIGKRTLYHPHENEQPFTRTLSGFHLPKDKKIIFIEAHDLKHGWSPDRVKIDMSQMTGDRYQIRLY